MDKKKIIAIVLVVVIVAIAFFYWKKKKALKPSTTEAEKTSNSGFNVGAIDTRNDNFPLTEGNSKGERVKTLQLALNKLNDKQGGLQNPLVPDGIFGPKTTAMLLSVAGIGYYGNNGVSEMQFNNLIILSNK